MSAEGARATLSAGKRGAGRGRRHQGRHRAAVGRLALSLESTALARVRRVADWLRGVPGGIQRGRHAGADDGPPTRSRPNQTGRASLRKPDGRSRTGVFQ